MAADLAEALHVVHSQGVVHRDIKPGNILLSPALSTGREFRAKLADFGIAYLIDSTRLTTPGTLIGTAAYLSPEQAEGAVPSPAADVYSLGPACAPSPGPSSSPSPRGSCDRPTFPVRSATGGSRFSPA